MGVTPAKDRRERAELPPQLLKVPRRPSGACAALGASLLLVMTTAVAQGREPSEKEISAAVGRHWQEVAENQRVMLERCKAGEKNFMCLSLMMTGVVEIKLLSLKKVRCSKSSDGERHVCTYVPKVDVISNSREVASMSPSMMNRETTWHFVRSGTELRAVTPQ